MPTEADFLQAIREQTTDDGLRLVYADWLEEHGDLRGGYLRAEVGYARENSEQARQLLLSLREPIDPIWAAMVSRPPYGILVPGLTFHDPGPKVTRASLRRVEKAWGMPLPADYAAFLLCHNGGRPSKPFLWSYAGTSDYYDEVRFFSTRDRHASGRRFLQTSVLDLTDGHVADGGDEERFARMMPIGAISYGEGWENFLVLLMDPDEEGNRILEVVYSEQEGLHEAEDVHGTEEFVGLLMELCERPEDLESE